MLVVSPDGIEESKPACLKKKKENNFQTNCY